MASLPAGIHLEEFVKLGNGSIEIALVTVGIPEIVSNHSFLGRQTLGLKILGDGLVKSAQIMQQHSEIIVSLPKPGVQRKSLAISGSRGSPVSLVA